MRKKSKISLIKSSETCNFHLTKNTYRVNKPFSLASVTFGELRVTIPGTISETSNIVLLTLLLLLLAIVEVIVPVVVAIVLILFNGDKPVSIIVDG